MEKFGNWSITRLINRVMNNLIKKLQFISAILIITLTTMGCRKPVTYMVPDSFKRYFYFPAGSWWVYKNQSGAYDTLTLLNTNRMLADFHAESPKQYERITMNYESTTFGVFSTSTDFISSFSYFTLCELNKKYFTELTDFGKTTDSSHKAYGCTDEIEWWIEDTVIINNKNYYNVVVNKTTSTIPSFIEDYPIKGYFKEDIGLIKRELQNGEIWELVDYKINK